MTLNAADIPVFILCGGLGTRIKEETELRPKPMIPIGDRPILWHIMHKYASHGFRRFVLCLGFKGEVIKSYFQNYRATHSDFTVALKSNEQTYHAVGHDEEWTVTLADTGQETMTGARVALAAQRYLGDTEHFAITYGDGLTDADLSAELDFHIAQAKALTVLGINPPSRFGQFQLEGGRVTRFIEKPVLADTWINGGYFFASRRALDYLSTDASCILERRPLEQMASEGQVALYRHRGFWACMDTRRDLDYLNGLWSARQAPWASGTSSSSRAEG